MAITTTPTGAHVATLKALFISEFAGAPATESDIGDAMANLLAKAMELTLIEVKDNAKALNGTAGGDTLDVD